jgi:hypothetical protein
LQLQFGGGLQNIYKFENAFTTLFLPWRAAASDAFGAPRYVSATLKPLRSDIFHLDVGGECSYE